MTRFLGGPGKGDGSPLEIDYEIDYTPQHFYKLLPHITLQSTAREQPRSHPEWQEDKLTEPQMGVVHPPAYAEQPNNGWEEQPSGRFHHISHGRSTSMILIR